MPCSPFNIAVFTGNGGMTDQYIRILGKQSRRQDKLLSHAEPAPVWWTIMDEFYFNAKKV